MSVHPTGLTKFEGYEIDRACWQLRYNDQPLPLNRKTFDLLLFLVDHADRVVSKDELLQALWPEQFVEESNLTQQVFLLRKALARHPSRTKIIETIPGRGYRFAVPVQTETGLRLLPETAQRTGPPTPPDSSLNSFLPAPVFHPFRTHLAVGALAVTVMLIALSHEFFFKHRSHLSIGTYTQITHDGHSKAIGGTDGNRIYFTRLEKSSIAQIPIAGGREALIPLTLSNPWSGDISPDGSTLLIISQASGQGPASSLWTLEVVGGSLHRIGNAISSAWSPDGKQIAYATAEGELMVAMRNGADAHRVASLGSGNVNSIAWSPDKHTIGLTRDGLLWQVSADGSNLHQLLPGWGKTPTQWNGHWAPDGNYFFTADGQIWLLEKENDLPPRKSPAPEQLTHGPTIWDHPIPTLDGKRLLAAGRTTRGELVRFDPSTGQSKPFLAGISAEFVSFSKTANALAYVSYPDGILWRANVDGSDPVQLTEAPFHPKSICWSPDGSQLAFVDRTADSVATLFTLAASAGSKPHRVFPSADAQNDPSWSPDGRRLAFSTAPNVGASARSDLRILDLATGQTTVVPGSDGLLVPRWSPDGQSLSAMTLDAQALKVLSLATHRWSLLQTGAVAFPEWSHDGRSIFYVRWTADPAIIAIRAADGKQRQIADLAGVRYTGTYTLWMGLDPEDRPLMLRDAGTDDIYALTLQPDN